MTVPSSAEDLKPRERALHLLNRLGFGPRPGDVERVLEAGLPRTLDRLLSPEKSEPSLDARLKACPAIGYSIDEIVKEHQRTRTRVNIESALGDLRAAKVIRAAHSEHPLREVMADFWYNHFNIYAYAWEPSVPAYDAEAIRPHVLGDFRTLLHAATKHPSMLFYLDNYVNVADRTVDGKLVRGLNENFGRELMELHTVGVDAGYTQQDVQAAARALTGWDFGGWGVYRFTFNPDKHDPDPKSVFGLALPAGGGQEDGDRLLDYLVSHPATAARISHRLLQRFVADDPPQHLLQSCAEVYTRTRGDIPSILKAIFESEEFWSKAFVSNKVKSPLEFVVSALRALDADVTDGKPVVTAVANMGMPLYDCKPPTGYSNCGRDWLGAASQVYRFDLAFKLAAGSIPGLRTNPDRLTAGATSSDAATLTKAMAEQILGRLSAETRKAASSVRASRAVSTATKIAGLLLASPEFQMR